MYGLMRYATRGIISITLGMVAVISDLLSVIQTVFFLAYYAVNGMLWLICADCSRFPVDPLQSHFSRFWAAWKCFREFG